MRGMPEREEGGGQSTLGLPEPRAWLLSGRGRERETNAVRLGSGGLGFPEAPRRRREPRGAGETGVYESAGGGGGRRCHTGRRGFGADLHRGLSAGEGVAGGTCVQRILLRRRQAVVYMGRGCRSR